MLGRALPDGLRGRPSVFLPLLLSAALAACGGGASAPARPPSALVIVVDSLRADRLGCYGAERATSPAIDALAREGLLLESARSVAPWTMPAVATLLTGLHPARHTVTRLRRRLPAEVDTLPEVLRARGFRSAAVVSHHLIGARYRYQQGFDVFREDPSGGHARVSTPEVTGLARAMLAELAAGDEPFFLFVHYFDPHYLYQGHPEFGWAAPRAGSLDGGEDIRELRARLAELTPEERAFLLDRYDEEIRFTDRGIGELLAALGNSGRAQETYVVLVADHGEEFLDHGWLGHTRTLYDELLRVPWIVRGPGIAPGRRSARPVSTVALAPTLLELLGLGADGAAFPARSEAGHWLGREDRAADEPALFAEVDYVDDNGTGMDAHKQAVVHRGFKLVRDETSGALELFDLRSDPGERANRAAAEPGRVAELLALLEAHRRRLAGEAQDAEEVELSADEVRALGELGYVGGDG